MYDGRFVRVGNAVSGLDPAFYPKSRIIWGCREIDSPMHGRRRYMCIVASIKINDKIEKRWLTTTIFSPLHVIM